MTQLQSLLAEPAYEGYAYAYPHKTAYRPLRPPVPLRQVWAGERRDALFLYLHVPFCEMRCGFCNLFTQTRPKDGVAGAYLAALQRQAVRVRAALGDACFARVAVGGGTPTFLDAVHLDNPIVLIALIYVAIFTPLPWMNLWGERRAAATEHSVSLREQRLEKTAERFRSSLSDQISVAIREAVNTGVTSFSATFRIFDQRGLRELADPEREVSTRSNVALKGLLTSLDSGSIGLAGPRGSGKTTLIDSFSRGRSMPFEKERAGLVVSAPVKSGMPYST